MLNLTTLIIITMMNKNGDYNNYNDNLLPRPLLPEASPTAQESEAPRPSGGNPLPPALSSPWKPLPPTGFEAITIDLQNRIRSAVPPAAQTTAQLSPKFTFFPYPNIVPMCVTFF